MQVILSVSVSLSGNNGLWKSQSASSLPRFAFTFRDYRILIWSGSEIAVSSDNTD